MYKIGNSKVVWVIDVFSCTFARPIANWDNNFHSGKDDLHKNRLTLFFDQRDDRQIFSVKSLLIANNKYKLQIVFLQCNCNKLFTISQLNSFTRKTPELPTADESACVYIKVPLVKFGS